MSEVLKRVVTGTAIIGAGALAFLGYQGNRDLRFTPEDQERAYRETIAGMTLIERYEGEFVRGISLCNPNDEGSFFSSWYIPPSKIPNPEQSCGDLDAEDDERLGSGCLAGSPYDTRVSRYVDGASLETVTGEADQLLVHPGSQSQPDLHFIFTIEHPIAATQETLDVLAAYNCPALELAGQR